MGNTEKKHWLLNLLIVITIIVVALAFTAHYKNWIKTEKEELEILSGIYFVKIPYVEMDSVTMVEKIPSMERINGFSVKEREKGVFKEDSLSKNKVYVYVDRLSQPKIRLVYQDSMKLFLNMPDSTETEAMYRFLSNKINPPKK
ncbi:hypothetical protein QSE00_23455 [Arenibacter sp. M-2]|uniref:hypothetical protein n=1 Tax=unclassified Arenibacter TaxID=2615047 RepID=UPI000D76A2DE|nr:MULTISPECIES: hypothetical protein [unclassified Arenibacter]MDL5514787.1 hypothetical protein [Arenibacter sp. M-2]PXX21566.1 hypothetical protein C7972_1329 [Arenibacter sp. ARW7G5Y1]|tara:strand:+ start:1353 stop:1784 length:432 start_codon:yes stop_codon:yes gene_type:complete